MFGIYTRTTSLFSKEFWKWAARRIIHKYSGPNAVEDSLLRGLKMSHIPFVRNQYHHGVDTALVLSGTGALTEAIARKKAKRLKMLVAGPNIVIDPTEQDRIICDDAIDMILVPSQWVLDLWKEIAPELAPRLKVWAAGVPIAKASTRSAAPIIYDKLQDSDFTRTITEELERLGCKPAVFAYGTFRQKDFHQALETAPFMIYLSRSESQGLALQEAWSHDVPTFVNHSTVWNHGTRSFIADQINAPYLREEFGNIFKAVSELEPLISLGQTIHPKPYCDAHLSDEASTRALLSLL